MSHEILNRIYNRIKNYSKIIELAIDTPKIANLAYNEFLISFVEMIYKFDGLNFLLEKLKSEEDEILKLKLAGLILPYERDVAISIFKNLSTSSNIYIFNSANGVLSQKYSTIEDLIEGTKLTIEKVKQKMKLFN